MTEDMSEFEEAAPAAGNAAVADLLAQARKLIGLEEQAEGLEQLLKALNGEITDLKTKVIPDKMAEVGLTEFVTPEGAKVKVEDFVSGALPKEPVKRDAAIGELELLGASDIIRNELTLTFEKRQHNEAMDLADELRAKGYFCEVKSGVHPQTYLAFIREALARGDKIDPDVMGVFVGRKTKVTLPKKKKVAEE